MNKNLEINVNGTSDIGLYFNANPQLLLQAGVATIIPFVGSITLTMPAGQSMLVFGRHQNGSVDAGTGVQLTATLPGENGAANISHAMTLNIVGIAEGVAGDGQVFSAAAGSPERDIYTGIFEYTPGNDSLSGGVGTDVMYGGRGADFLLGGADNDRLEGDAEYLLVVNPANVFDYMGGVGDEWLCGESSDHVMLRVAA